MTSRLISDPSTRGRRRLCTSRDSFPLTELEFIRLQSPCWCSVHDRGIRHPIPSVCHLKLTIQGRHDANPPTTPLWSWHHSGLLEEDSAFDQTQFIDVSRDSTSQTKFVALRSRIFGSTQRVTFNSAAASCATLLQETAGFIWSGSSLPSHSSRSLRFNLRVTLMLFCQC